MQTLQHWISRYLLDCQYQKGLDPKTIKAYRIDSAQFSALVDQRNLELTREGIMEYIADLHQEYKPKTIRRKIASIKAFCSYLGYEELIKENPFSRLRLKLSAPLILPRTIPLSAIGAILAAAYHVKECAKTPGQRDVVLRDIAVLELLFATGGADIMDHGGRLHRLLSVRGQPFHLTDESGELVDFQKMLDAFYVFVLMLHHGDEQLVDTALHDNRFFRPIVDPLYQIRVCLQWGPPNDYDINCRKNTSPSEGQRRVWPFRTLQFVTECRIIMMFSWGGR